MDSPAGPLGDYGSTKLLAPRGRGSANRLTQRPLEFSCQSVGLRNILSFRQ